MKKKSFIQNLLKKQKQKIQYIWYVPKGGTKARIVQGKLNTKKNLGKYIYIKNVIIIMKNIIKLILKNSKIVIIKNNIIN